MAKIAKPSFFMIRFIIVCSQSLSRSVLKRLAFLVDCNLVIGEIGAHFRDIDLRPYDEQLPTQDRHE